MIVDETIAQLLARTTQKFALVEGAAELASLTDQPPAMPAAYVYIAEEASGENSRMSGGLLQVVQCDLAVVIITSNVTDATGHAASSDLRALISEVRAALLGWQPASADDAISHVSGSLVKAKSGVLWWEEKFATSYLLEA